MPCAADRRPGEGRSFARILQLVATRRDPGRDAAMTLLACRLEQGLREAMGKEGTPPRLTPPRGAPASSRSE